jgi:hypothetical protein
MFVRITVGPSREKNQPQCPKSSSPHLESSRSKGDSFTQSLRRSSSLVAPDSEMLVWLATVGTPGQAEYLTLSENLPREFLLEVGSANFLSFTWDLLSFLCQHLSQSIQPEGGLFSDRPARWQWGLCASCLLIKECQPYAIPELPAAQLESTPAASWLGTQGGTTVPRPSTKASPLQLLP